MAAGPFNLVVIEYRRDFSSSRGTHSFMCGIAGIVNLVEPRAIEPQIVRRMAEAITHRGPDEDGFFFRPGLGMANRRLSIVGLADGKQPIHNEDHSVAVVFN